ncbi:hypothetical protein O4328_29195 [Rhodococcus opacus]|uniref:Uncharacterized protein n=1 Tax=Rhodococcus opacus TaxID=37919 RepID=A0AAX3YSD5_RHOOP|nr:hypothetical protein [Rhodococcus opacus]MCZ4587719.1 hypothetical protein [Rhodococcus opacus]WLF51286.1 hypothetical protein Q5707_38645 [Rhodococcus opacus]
MLTVFISPAYADGMEGSHRRIGRGVEGLSELWVHYESVQDMRDAAAAATERGDVQTATRRRELAERAQSRLPTPTHLEALAISIHLENQLHNARFDVVRRALADGASWSDIGRILGMTKQSAHAWYRRQHRKPTLPNPTEPAK